MSSVYMNVIETFCREHGIGKDRRIRSSKGRTGFVSGIEWNQAGTGKVWVMVDNTPGNIKVDRRAFLKLPIANGHNP